MHGSLIEVEILTSLLPNVFAQFGLVLGGAALPMDVFTHPKWYTNVPICLRNSQINAVQEALIEAEILTCPLPMYLLNLALFPGTHTLCPQVCQHLSSDL